MEKEGEKTPIPPELLKGPFQVAMVGHQCGKSRLLCRFLYQTFEEVDDPTVEDNYTKNNFKVDESECGLKLLDTSGNDFYANLYEKWFGSAEGIIVVYSITSIYSFDAIPSFIDQIRKIKKTNKIPMVLVATQSDLSKNREITNKEGLSIAYRYKCPFVEASSKTGENVEYIFQEIIRQIRRRKQEEHDEQETNRRVLRTNTSSKNLLERKGSSSKILENPDKYGVLKLGGGLSRKKIWVAIKEGVLYLYGSQKDFQEHKPNSTANLLTCTVKPIVSKDKKFCFDVVSINKTYNFQADSQEEMMSWIEKIQEGIARQINTVLSVKESKQLQTVQVGIRTPEEEWRLVQKMSKENYSCADCNASDPDWTSINLGILICIQCSGVHRSLGVHITKVRSLTLDKLDDEIYQFLKFVGNAKANKIWEALVPSNLTKPQPKDDRAIKEKWIKMKYVEKLFVNKTSIHDLQQSFYESISKDDLFSAMLLRAQGANFDWPNQKENGRTALHKASEEGYLMSSVWLVQSGATVEILDQDSKTPLDLAKSKKMTQVEAWLFKKSAATIEKRKSMRKSIRKTMRRTMKPKNNNDSMWLRSNVSRDRIPTRVGPSIHRPTRPRNSTAMWSISVKSPFETVNIVAQPDWKIAEAIGYFTQYFSHDCSGFGLFVETPEGQKLLSDDTTIRGVVLSISGQLIFKKREEETSIEQQSEKEDQRKQQMDAALKEEEEDEDDEEEDEDDEDEDDEEDEEGSSDEDILSDNTLSMPTAWLETPWYLGSRS